MTVEYGLYTVYDKVAEEAMPPFIARTDGQAQRVFMSMKIESPNDYLLYQVGKWDPFEAEIIGVKKRVIPLNKEDPDGI